MWAGINGAFNDEAQYDFTHEYNILADALNDFPMAVSADSDSEEDQDAEDAEISDPPMQLQFFDNEDTLFTHPETIAIWMPSRNPSPTLSALCRQELLLRESQALEALQGIRYGIGHKSVLMKFLVRRN